MVYLIKGHSPFFYFFTFLPFYLFTFLPLKDAFKCTITG